MRHAARRNARNAAYLLAGVCCVMALPLFYAIHQRDPEVVTIYQACPYAAEVERADDKPSLLDRITHRHRHRPAGIAGGAAGSSPPIVCPAYPPTTRQDVHSVPEPTTLALMVAGAALMAWRRV